MQDRFDGGINVAEDVVAVGVVNFDAVWVERNIADLNFLEMPKT